MNLESDQQIYQQADRCSASPSVVSPCDSSPLARQPARQKSQGSESAIPSEVSEEAKAEFLYR